MTQEKPAFLTPAEAATALRVEVATIWKWAKAGKIQHERFGRLIRIPRYVVEPAPAAAVRA
jgi:excisionase family DNA binding protein